MQIEEKIVGAPERAFNGSYGDYWLGRTKSAHKEIMRIANDYKTNQLKKMKALNPRYLNPRSRRFINFEDGLVLTVKVDGEFNLFYYDVDTQPTSIFLNTPRGRARYNLPVNKEIHKIIDDLNNNAEKFEEFHMLFINHLKTTIFNRNEMKIRKIVLAGELHANIKKATDRPRVSDFLALSRHPESFDDLKNINFDVFDILSINDFNLQSYSYEFRLKVIESLFPRGNEATVRVVKHLTNVEGKKAHEIFNQWVEQENQEGLVIFDKFNKAFKVKKVHTIDAVIIGFVEMLKEKRIRGFDAISAVLVAVMRMDGTYQVLATVGGGFSEEQRIDFHKLLKDDVVNSRYKETNREGRAFRFVIPKYVIELRYLDIITQDYEGNSKLKMALEFSDQEWKIKRIVPFVSLINPYFKMLRTDVDLGEYPSLEFANTKLPFYENINIDQIYRMTYIESPKDIAEIESLPNSEILFRIVYKVAWGGVDSAKKIIMWRTNKDETDTTYPKYIVYYADYSYKRVRPLEQQVYPFTSLNKAIKHLNYLYKRPDSPQKGFFDAKTQTALKKSIKSPPHTLFVHDDIKELLKTELDSDVLNLFRH